MLNRRVNRDGNLAIRMLGFLAVLAGLIGIMYFTLPKESQNRNERAGANVVENSAARRCEDHLADLIEGMSPGRLGISSERSQLIDRLNNWKSECGAVVTDVHPSSDSGLLEEVLSGDTRARALSDRYLATDASHIRMSLLARDIAGSLVEGNTSNLDRAVMLFDFASRAIMLINDEIRETMPLTAYECLLFGLGTDQDRAWVFAELLRQTRTDAVILTPRNDELAEHWLIGVIDAHHGILLFDPRLGLPIPAEDCPDDTPYPKVPATLQQVLQSDAAFRQLDLPDSPYPLDSEAMKDLQISLIGTSSGWAPRTAVLQYLLPQGVHVELYDGLGANELRSPGLQQRVIDAGADGLWTSDQVSIWPYIAKVQTEFESTRGEGDEGSQLFNMNFVFRGPYVPRASGKDASGQETYQPVPIDKTLHFVRVEQLRGKYTDAIKDYLPVRTTVKLVESPANEMASEFATLWTGISQYQTQKIRTALGTLDRFVASSPRSVGMVRVALEYMADCLLMQKNYQLAVQILRNLPPGFAPQRDGYLIRRWAKIGGFDPDQPFPADPEEAPAEDEDSPADGTPPATPEGEAMSQEVTPEEAMSADSMPAAPASGEPVPEEPAPPEPNPEEPGESPSEEPAPEEPAPAEPASGEPVPEEPAPPEPNPEELGESPSEEPAPEEPAPAEPASGEPVPEEPAPPEPNPEELGESPSEEPADASAPESPAEEAPAAE